MNLAFKLLLFSLKTLMFKFKHPTFFFVYSSSLFSPLCLLSLKSLIFFPPLFFPIMFHFLILIKQKYRNRPDCRCYITVKVCETRWGVRTAKEKKNKPGRSLNFSCLSSSLVLRARVMIHLCYESVKKMTHAEMSTEGQDPLCLSKKGTMENF